ncbi:MAG: rod shape-determining protein MreD [Candidatus Nanopelagicaceae bacterium]|nr:rod shape-determining protein MreD [Candidatus Nanopelagicaceae bacterium]
MFIKKFSFTSAIFIFVFIIQESLVNQLTLPAGGFSLFLILTLVWAAPSTPEIAASVGFGAGLLLDLSPSTNGPLGHWTLILVLLCFAISFFSYGDENMRGNPLSLIFMVTVGHAIALVAYVASGFLLGMVATSFSQTISTIIGSSIWTLVMTPLTLPAIAWLHNLAFESRMRL